MFVVFRALFDAAPKDPAVKHKVNRVPESEGLRYRLAYACNRTLGFAYRGLDWLPPGDASFADLVAAMLAADLHFFPNDERVRKVVVREARLRQIPLAKPVEFVQRVRIPANAAERRDFIDDHRESLGIPSGARPVVTVRAAHIYAPPLIPKTNSEPFDLRPDISRWTSAETEHRLIKLGWWQREQNDVAGWGTHRRYRTGATIITDKSGVVRTFLQHAHSATATSSRSSFLRLMLTGERTPQIGPDGLLLQQGLRASLEGNTLSITGAMQALHVAGDFE
jgi:hypothetical protein